MLALWFIAAHMVGDYIAQTGWMAANKMKRADALLIHVLCYTACFAGPAFFYAASWQAATVGLAALAVMHGITDCRRWASGAQWPPKPILVDQAMHAVQIAIVAEIVTRL